jgi:hypothetical protein
MVPKLQIEERKDPKAHQSTQKRMRGRFSHIILKEDYSVVNRIHNVTYIIKNKHKFVQKVAKDCIHKHSAFL